MQKIIVLLLCFLVMGCKNGTLDGATFTNHFVQGYCIADHIEKIGLYRYATRAFYVTFGGELVYDGKRNSDDPDKFHELAQKYGDISYNRRVVPFRNNALANELTGISVVSDSDYDESHPAGTQLDDIIYFNGESFYSFVSSGYRGQESTFFDKPLNELLAEDMKLLDIDDMWFRFSTPPTASQEHNITLTITDADGNTFTATKFIGFDDPSLWIN